MNAKQWKYVIPLTVALAVASAGCSLLPGGKGEGETQPAIPSLSPVVEVSEDYYGSIQPYQQNQTRGMLSSMGYRIDFSHLELGLMEIARETFPTADYLFQEGQLITRDQVRDWIAEEKAGAPNGKQKTSSLVHVLEHDYLRKDDQQLAGMVLGLSLTPEYQDATGQNKIYTIDELRAKGQQLAAKIVQSVRANSTEVPIVVALYQVPEPNSSLVPGRFIMSGTVNANEASVSKWVPIDEAFFLFPSGEAEKAYPQQSLQYDKLKRHIQSAFKEYIGITGVGRFMGGKLTEMTITATAEYDSRTEVLQFTQFAAAGIEQAFEKSVHVNLYVQTINQPLGIYIRPANGEPYMHIYRK
ncbi:CamS family sex pheromone protein [Brevibacillus composti]|uniref:CamS family sex pheromone protein n=2 Tax=Brevibacillus composti TaxID=2796470 RepID=A0A7T5ELR9_9BACL|nr:CamS family sex pheromone protein [Brevibacillus composti]QQE74964.1 CamS family sex pheromone protein [Brevibacillus composti]QUO42048.1 CamS family sex pheromone protein [Brevibacillus composti]